MWGRETLLVYFMTGHWRKPIDYSDAGPRAGGGASGGLPRRASAAPSEPAPEDAWERFAAALDDDFNTPEALARHARVARPRAAAPRRSRIFGLDSLAEQQSAPAEVVALAEQRAAARGAGDCGEADRLRAAIEEAGWVVRDVPGDGGFQLVPQA